LRDVLEWFGVEAVVLVATFSTDRYELGLLEHVKVLGDCLARRADSVSNGETSTDLEESLPVPLCELVEDLPARRISQSFEQFLVLHIPTIGKSELAYQAGLAAGSAAY
jgi:hypothetical protein